MKKKTKTLFMLLCWGLCSLLLFCGCNKTQEEETPLHEHYFSVKSLDGKFLAKEGTCKEVATYYYICECGEKGSATFSGDTLADHVWEDDVCKHCGLKRASTGLTFVSNGDGTCYVSGIGTSSDTEFHIPTVSPTGDTVTGIGTHAFAYCKELKSVTFAQDSKIISIAPNAFYGCEQLTSITLPASVESIGENAFNGCKGLSGIVLPEDAHLSSIGYAAFEGCAGLTGVYIEDLAAWCAISFDGSSSNPLIYAHDLYVKNKLVTDLVIPNHVRKISLRAFEGCTGITSVRLPASVTKIGAHAFDGCTNLEGVYINDVAAWCNVSFGGDYANPLCYGHNLYVDDVLVTGLEIPASVTNVKYMAFYGASSLTCVTFAEDSQLTAIGSGAFYDCTGLTSISLPATLETIGSHVFYGCQALESITIPTSVTSIGSYAFSCDENVEMSLTSVLLENANGWYLYASSTADSGRYLGNFDQSMLASYFKSTYSTYYWKRS